MRSHEERRCSILGPHITEYALVFEDKHDPSCVEDRARTIQGCEQAHLTPEQRGNNLQGFGGFYLKARTIIWSWLYYMCRVCLNAARRFVRSVGNGHLKPLRPKFVPARPKVCTRHVREPLRFPKTGYASGLVFEVDDLRMPCVREREARERSETQQVTSRLGER